MIVYVGEGAESDEGEGEEAQHAVEEPSGQSMLTLDQAVAQSELIQVDLPLPASGRLPTFFPTAVGDEPCCHCLL